VLHKNNNFKAIPAHLGSSRRTIQELLGNNLSGTGPKKQAADSVLRYGAQQQVARTRVQGRTPGGNPAGSECARWVASPPVAKSTAVGTAGRISGQSS
jgi:hypothetical protein